MCQSLNPYIMPITNISFSKPSDPYLGEGLNMTGVMPSYYLEMDVDNSYDVKSLLQVQGGTKDDVTLSVTSKYATISSSGILTAIKQTKGAKEFPPFPDHIILAAKAKSGNAVATLLVRIYDRPTGHQIVESYTVNGQTYRTESKLLKTGLEVKPGDSFTVQCKVFPATAQQVVRLFSKNDSMQNNIRLMNIKDNPCNGVAQTTFTLSKSSSYYAGVKTLNSSESSTYGTYLISKRAPSGAKRYTFREVNIQVVEYYAEEPKPLDFMTMSIPYGFKYSIGGRIGTIDGGLRIRKDSCGRSLIKDTYKKVLPKGSIMPCAVVFEMSKDGRFPNNNGIEFTYHWDELYETGMAYEPNTRSKYKAVHGYAIAIHPYGKSVQWSNLATPYVYSTSPSFKKGDYDFGKRTCTNEEDGLRLTAHYHFYNREDTYSQVKPVQLLEEYDRRYPTIHYVQHDSAGNRFTVPSWFIPSTEEILKLEFNKDTNMRKALAERINYCNGNFTNPNSFWTCCLEPNNYTKAQFAIWDVNKVMMYRRDLKTAKYDFRPFHRF